MITKVSAACAGQEPSAYGLRHKIVLLSWQVTKLWLTVHRVIPFFQSAGK